MSRPYKLFSGVAYPCVIRGDNPTREVTASNYNDREETYYDPAIKLSEADLGRIGSLSGKPICFEHDRENAIGEISRAWVDDKMQLRITARIWQDLATGRRAWQELKRGNLSQLSVGYRPQAKVNEWGIAHITHKLFDEVSLVKQGFFPNTDITVSATKAATYKSNPTKVNFRIVATMDSTTATTQIENNTAAAPAPAPETTAAPETPLVDTSQELLKQTDILQKELERLKAEKAALEMETPEQIAQREEYAQLKAAEEARQKAYAEENLKKMETMFKQQEEVLGYKLDEVDKNYAEGLKPVFASQTFSGPAKIMSDLAAKASAEKKRNAELEARLQSMEAKMAAMNENHAAAVSQVSASRSQIMGLADSMQKAEVPAVTASSSAPATMADAFAQVYTARPSAREQQLLKDEGIHPVATNPAFSVTASDGDTPKAIPELPEHPYVSKMPNSLARRKDLGATAPWAWAMTQNTGRFANQTNLKMAPLANIPERFAPSDKELGLSTDPTKMLPY